MIPISNCALSWDVDHRSGAVRLQFAAPPGPAKPLVIGPLPASEFAAVAAMVACNRPLQWDPASRSIFFV
jgi:hypothetical protein